MAGRALERGMHAGEGKACHFQMIELGSKPGIHGVAVLAGGWKARGHVIDNRSLEVLLMTGIAGRRKSLELARSRALVAGHAIEHGVRSDKWKAVLVITNVFDRDLPTLD